VRAPNAPCMQTHTTVTAGQTVLSGAVSCNGIVASDARVTRSERRWRLRAFFLLIGIATICSPNCV
ncbi:hypothetical protein, partial [Undibacterium sp. 5I1]|uniref:hypothetical protein n=1 Tax=Undibacterium sp. 5I1 TaxID=3048590 RepID=UPI002B223BA8